MSAQEALAGVAEEGAAPGPPGSGDPEAGPGALPAPVTRAAEAAFLLLLPPLCGLWLQPGDPLFVRGGFHWLALPPLLLGLRRGSTAGGLSALALVLLLYGAHRAHLPSLEPFPFGLAAELLVLGLVTGEFSDQWTCRLRHLSLRAAYLAERQRLFARAHHLLGLSHEALEQRLLGECQSLRDALMQLQRRVTPGAHGAPLRAIGEPLMQIFAGFGWLHRAALYEVTGDGPAQEVVACIGAPPGRPPAEDPVVREALRSGQLALLDQDGADGQEPDVEGARVAVPLADLSGRIHGVLCVFELAFSAFTDRYLTMLALLGGHVGDLLSGAAAGQSEEFRRRLSRCLEDARRHRVSSALVALVVHRERAAVDLAEELLHFRRSLDLALAQVSRGGDPVVLLLLPLLDEEGLAGFRRRLEARLRERGGLEQVTIHPRLLCGADARPDALQELLRECGVAA